MSIAVITGGAGFVGSNLAEALVARGDTVISLDNYSSGSRNYVEGCHYFYCELSEPLNLSYLERFGRPDCVFHLAAATRIHPSFSDPGRYWRSNCDATFNVLEWTREIGSPLVYAGSSSHHGGKFRNPYTFTKDLGEDVVKMYGRTYGIKASISRFYNVYGPRESEDEEHATLIGRWRSRYLKGLPLVVYGDGSKRRDFTHVSDVVEAMIRIMDKEAYGYTFEIGRGRSLSVGEILGLFGTDNVEYMPERPGEVERSLRANNVARDVLGWEAKMNVEDYIAEARRSLE